VNCSSSFIGRSENQLYFAGNNFCVSAAGPGHERRAKENQIDYQRHELVRSGQTFGAAAAQRRSKTVSA